METKVKNGWTVEKLIKLQKQQILRVNHEYQRGLRWAEMQKRMFIDSIFRGYSIPAFYFHKTQTGTEDIQNTYFDIVDGQQRIDAIYSYSESAFPLLDPSEDQGFRFPNFVKDDPCPWGGKRFAELSEEFQSQLKNHKVVVYEITTENEDSIRDLFIRLQGGTPLTPQDKRDSWPGNFTEFVLKTGGKTGVDRWYGHPFFKERVKGNESRRRQLVAQVFMLFHAVRNNKKFCDINSPNIDQFYHAQVGFDYESKDAKQFEKICNTLHNAFDGKQSIVGHYIIHLFLLADSLLTEYANEWQSHLAEKLFRFEERRRKAAADNKKGVEPENPRYYTEYGQWTQTRSDGADKIMRRHAFFAEEMLKLLSPVKLDGKRGFNEHERKTVFFRDRQTCQWCRMQGNARTVLWDDCEIHHVRPYTHGGPTDIQNAALMHRECHPKKRDDVKVFADWWNKNGGAHRSDVNNTGARTNTGTRTHRFRPRTLPPDGTRIKFHYNNERHEGKIQDRRIVLSGDVACTSFSEASKYITGTNRNGWKDWELRLPGENSWVLADQWRDR